MNFREFQDHRSAILAASPEVVDLGETNIWRALSTFVPILSQTAGRHIHRCHLAQAWLSVFGMPAEWSSRALVSCGVRDSLSLLFAIAKERRQHVLMPTDVYPTYSELARASGVSFDVFRTLPELRIPTEGDWLLLANPLKPAGRWLTENEIAGLKCWLAKSPTRRILLDVVYTFSTRFHPTTKSLIDTGQAIILHSLSKGWLHPQVFGIAFVPEIDAPGFAPVFREHPPPQEKLWQASQLLNDDSCPSVVDERLTANRFATMALLPDELKAAIMHPNGVQSAGYLIPIAKTWESVLKRHGLLTIPLSVFGSTEEVACVVSTLIPTERHQGRV